jgi:ankyrin repeat protein
MSNPKDLVMPLIEAVFDNDRDLTLRLLREGANPNIKDHNYPGPWRLFNVKCVGSFLLYEAVNLGSRSVRRKSDTGVIEALLEYKAKVDMTDDHGFSSTHQAASMNNREALAILLANGADMNLKSKSGYTPLHTAIYGEADACVEMLLNSGADSSLHTVKGLDCMEYARSLHRKDMMALLESRAAMKAITDMLSGINSPQSKRANSL